MERRQKLIETETNPDLGEMDTTDYEANPEEWQ
jgi:hypothetical protein